MEREPDMAHAPIRLGAHHRLDGAVALRLLPTAAVQRMQQVEVEVIHVQALELDAQEPVEVLRRLIEPRRRFAGDVHTLAVAVFERASQDHFGTAAQIVVGRVKIVDAAVDRVADHRDGRVDVDSIDADGIVRLAAVLERQAHHAESQRRHLDARLPHCAQFHGALLCPYESARRHPPPSRAHLFSFAACRLGSWQARTGSE